MSVLFDAAADRLLRTAEVPLRASAFTHMGYYRRIAATGGLQTIVARIQDDLSPYSWCGLLNDGTLYFEDEGGGSVSFGYTFSDTDFHHVAFSWDGTTIFAWVDGVSVGSTGITVMGDEPDRYEIGGWRTSNGNRWNGNVGALKAFSVAMNTQQINDEIGVAAAVRQSDIYGVWPLLSDYNDISGSNRHWTALGDLDFSGAVPGVDYGATGAIAQISYHRRQLSCPG